MVSSDPVLLPPLHAAVIRRTWMSLALLIATDAAWLWMSGVGFPVKLLCIIGGASLFLFAVSYVYRYRRRDDAIWLAAQLVNQLIIGSGALATVSYLGLRLNYPLRDALFTSLDTNLAFDWLTYIAWVNSHPLVARIYSICYAMTGPEILLMLPLLCICSCFKAFHRYVLGYLLAGFVTVVAGTVWPATTAYIYHGTEAAAYPHLQIADAVAYKQEFFAMRDHTMKLLPEVFQGVVAFPSFHSVLAMLAIYAAWSIPFRVLRIGIIALNVMMLLSTPVDGGHYLVDTLSGIALGMIAAHGAAWWVAGKER